MSNLVSGNSSVDENRYRRDFCLKSSFISLFFLSVGFLGLHYGKLSVYRIGIWSSCLSMLTSAVAYKILKK